jgi:putative Ig domain-containing protein
MRKTTLSFFLCALCVLCVFAGCSGGSKPIALVLNFTGTAPIDNGQSVNITVTGAGSKGVMWSLASFGTLSNQTTTSVTYNAPASVTAPVTDHLTATSLNDSTKTVTLVINVTPPPAITTTSLPNGIVGTAYNQTLTATGGAGTLAFTVSVGTLPAGLTLSSAGAITGTPTAVGMSSFTVKVADSSIGGPQSATKALSITVNQAPAITSASTATFVVGTAGTFKVTTTGTPTPSLTETGALPTGVTFKDNGDGTGTLSGTPAAGTAKNYSITFTASSGVGTAATQNFTLTVGQPAAITSAASTTFTVGTAGSFNVTTTGFPAPSLTETGALPTGVTFKDNGNGAATLSGTPAAGTGGTYAITIKAHNGIGTDASQSFTLTVDETPAITSANKTTFTLGTAGTFTVTASGFPTPSITESGALPTGVTFVDNKNGTGTLAGVPAPGTVGTYSITFTPSNGIGSPAGQSFTLTVGQPPAITSANSTTFTVGTAGSFNVTTTGFPAPSLSESGTLPSGVTFVDNKNGSGTLSGTPAAGTGKTYSITFTASNGVGSNATQTFALTVDQAPAITSANNTTFTVGAAGTFTVTTTGFPAPALSESGALPTGVTFKDNGNGTGTLSGTPTTAGTFSITFTATNGVGTPATQSFTLTVNTAPVITSASSTTFTVGTAGTFTVTTSGTPTPTLTETGALPTGVTFKDNGDGTGTLSGTPAAGTGKTYSITFKASNSVGSNSQTFTLTVDEAPAITSPNSTTFTEGVSGSFTVMTTGFPAPALTETGALPSGVTFVDNGNGTGKLSGTPAAGSANTYSITFTATNSVGAPATQSFTLTVNTAPVITSASSTTFTVGIAGTFTVTATGTPSPAISETGTLPTGVTFTSGTGSGTLSGTPAAGTGGTYTITFKATSSSGTTQQSFTLTVDQAPAITSANSATFTVGTAGTFTVTTTGFPLDPITETGPLPSGVTFVDNGNNTATLSGTPAAGTAGTYPITITASNGVLPNATQAFTLTVSAAGACSSSGSESLLKGQYVVMLKGVDSSGNPVLIGAVLSFDGTGSITGSVDLNLSSGFDTANGGNALTITSASYNAGSDQRGCMTITTAAGKATYRFSLGNISSGVASTGHVIGFDAAGPFVAGTLRKQTLTSFSASTIKGSFTFGASSLQNPGAGGGKFAVLGVINFNGTGGIISGTEDFNDNGTIDGSATTWPTTSPVNFNPTGSTTTIASNGRGILTIAIVGTTQTFSSVLYVISATEALFISKDSQTSNHIVAGEALQQSGPFSLSSISGLYIGYNTGAAGSAAIFLVNSAGNGNFTLTLQQDKAGVFSSVSGPGTYTLTSADLGRFLVNTGGKHITLLYLVSANKAFSLNDNGGVDFGFIQSQTGTSASGAYAFGTADPEAGVATFNATAKTGTVTSDTNSNGTLSPDQSSTFTFAIDSTGLVSIPSGCTISATTTNCTTLIYVISPTKAVAMPNPTSTAPNIDVADQ